MEEKERYINLSDRQVKDTQNNSQDFLRIETVCKRLNQQDKELSKLRASYQQVKEENQQLRQSQKQLAIKELEELQKEFDYCPYSGDKIYVAEVYDKIFAKIQELGGGENVKN